MGSYPGPFDVKDLTSRSDEVSSSIHSFFQELKQILSLILNEGKEKGKITCSIDTPALCTVILSTMQGILILRQHDWREKKIEDGVQALLYLLKPRQ